MKRALFVGLVALVAGLVACGEAGDRPDEPTSDRADTAAQRVTPADTGVAESPAEAGTPRSDSSGAADRSASPEPRAPLSDLERYDTVFVYFHGPIPDGELEGQLLGLPRPVPAGTDGLSFALQQLLAGPTEAESPAGPYNTWFSEATAGMLRWVTLDDGVATVEFDDFRSIISGASSSAGSAMLMRQLKATVFQFPEVRRVEFRIDGSCEEFMAWLQIGCVPVPRSSFAAPEGYRTAVDTDSPGG